MEVGKRETRIIYGSPYHGVCVCALLCQAPGSKFPPVVRCLGSFGPLCVYGEGHTGARDAVSFLLLLIEFIRRRMEMRPGIVGFSRGWQI